MTTTRNRRPAIWCAVIVCAYSLAPAATIALGDTDSIARDALQWQPTEWTVSHPGDVANPFDVRAQVVFEHGESGERRATEMFTTSGGEWRFRRWGTFRRWRTQGRRVSRPQPRAASSQPPSSSNDP